MTDFLEFEICFFYIFVVKPFLTTLYLIMYDINSIFSKSVRNQNNLSLRSEIPYLGYLVAFRMTQNILVSIAGSRATGVYDTGLKIKEGLKRLFPHDIKVLDLDSMTNDGERAYNAKDYDFVKIQQSTKTSNKKLQIVLLCGCYALYDKDINQSSNLKVFLDAEGDKRLIKLIQNKKVKTGSELATTISEYLDFLRPEYHSYIEPTRAFADLIIPAANEAIGTAIIIDGIVKVVEELQGGGVTHGKKLFPHLDFQMERMDVEKGRYYDLS
ncbi:putative uridine kinase DAS2 Ecym_4756 [Eremothecium cymbalariae DBVPG|uniref:Phosphoribulokinase/uridine kinase domain-containing protein n=1 Tax=Eremothecium cymbalariae (strain CBS 270.75 / DBVPG 7215 / KCTC 17166 / NRRL Y-17582) TaxID=931890 RepID=G8JSP7_ERECY|nr:hypothetical protein Ecym_4756 [Eremothecium cymbalariae DBVPG\